MEAREKEMEGGVSMSLIRSGLFSFSYSFFLFDLIVAKEKMFNSDSTEKSVGVGMRGR